MHFNGADSRMLTVRFTGFSSDGKSNLNRRRGIGGDFIAVGMAKMQRLKTVIQASPHCHA
jgi:hypothetical protein